MQIVLKINQHSYNECDDDFLPEKTDPRFRKWRFHDGEDDGIIYFVSPKNVVWTLERCLRYFDNRRLIFGDIGEQYKVLRILDFLVDKYERAISYEPETYIPHIEHLRNKYPYFKVQRETKKEQYELTF